jgi:hypothetical protein
MLRIPPFKRGRVTHASSAESFYRHSNRQPFANPLPVAARTAVLGARFAEKGGVRCFEPDSHIDIQAFNPEILAGTVHALLRLAPVVRDLRAIVAFSGSRLGDVTMQDRDLLWKAFQVPVFEQRLAADGTVIARECEAHDGLHLYVAGSYSGSTRREPCECGRSEPRI